MKVLPGKSNDTLMKHHVKPGHSDLDYVSQGSYCSTKTPKIFLAPLCDQLNRIVDFLLRSIQVLKNTKMKL